MTIRWLPCSTLEKGGLFQVCFIQVLESRVIFHEDYSYWIGLGSLIGFTALFGYTLALTYLNPIGKPQAVISRESYLKSKIVKKILFLICMLNQTQYHLAIVWYLAQKATM